jgi:prepilin-type N-terminal cleavage/methylation domain-containing protein
MSLLFRHRPSAGRRGSPASFARARGFTLIELLIVISIIAILGGITLVAIGVIQRRVQQNTAIMEVKGFADALSQYEFDEKSFPGWDKKPDPERNDFPLLYNVLLGEPSPNGPGGRSAPYLKLNDKKVMVLEVGADDSEAGEAIYRVATKAEREDPRVQKYYLDPWGRPYVYRCNKGKKRAAWMINPDAFDIYSLGPDGVDATLDGEVEDEIHN